MNQSNDNINIDTCVNTNINTNEIIPDQSEKLLEVNINKTIDQEIESVLKRNGNKLKEIY